MKRQTANTQREDMEIENRTENIKKEFQKRFGNRRNLRFFQAPGRVNLIGEHTDYNAGFVLPACINRSIIVGASLNNRNILRLASVNFNNVVECDLDSIEYKPEHGWANYPKGVAKTLQKHGYNVKGIDMVFEGNVPVGSGLSSSAAIEIVSCLALVLLSDIEMEREKIPFLCQEAEKKFIDVRCGIMDQYVITFSKKGCALFLDCRSMQYEHIPFDNSDILLVVTNTEKKRELLDSEYNIRRSQCEEGVKILKQFLVGVKQLRDVTCEQFEKYKSKLPEVVKKRCEHVIYENDRVLRAKEYLTKRKFMEFGNLMNESHLSLKRLYEVSCPELDTIVETSQEIDGVLGSRMTGGGFGGCAVTVVRKESVQELAQRVSVKYQEKFNIEPEFYVCEVEGGASELTL
ncbi:galactokinase [candidate division WOR-3 bacterium]|nr:galactokinase [candidate division WOR-3 bacterium]